MYNLITTMTSNYICDMQIHKPSTHLVTYAIVRYKSNIRLDCDQTQAPGYNRIPQPSHEESKDLVMT